MFHEHNLQRRELKSWCQWILFQILMGEILNLRIRGVVDRSSSSNSSENVLIDISQL